MSNALAISAVTATLRHLLLQAGIGNVTTLPLDKAAAAQPSDRVNLLLYQVVPNAAWRNQPMPGRIRPGEQGYPPLALNLQYLLTAYGDDGPSLVDHRLLGRAMLALHDHPVLDLTDIQDATNNIRDQFLETVPDLHQQIERVKLTFQVMNMEELSKLWSTFQTQYRLSVPFEASVVLIESGRGTRTPLPVIKRGEKDRGWDTQPNLGPLIDRVDYLDPTVLGSRPFPAASFPKFGQEKFVCSLVGTDLPLRDMKILIHDSRQAPGQDLVASIDPLPLSTKERIRFEIDPQLAGARWVSGMLSVSLQYPGLNQKVRTTSPQPFLLAPRLRLAPTGRVLAIPSVEQGKSLLTVSCDPPLAADTTRLLSARLVLDADNGDSRQLKLASGSLSHSPTTPTFDATDIPPGEYRVRLRVDLVDSLPFQRSLLNPALLEMDESQKITIG